MNKQYAFLVLLVWFVAGCSRTDDEESFILKHYRVVNLMDEPATLRFFKVHDKTIFDQHLYKDSLFIIPPGDTVLIGTERLNPPFDLPPDYIIFGVFDSASISFDNWPARTFMADPYDGNIARPTLENILQRRSYRQLNEVKQGNTYISDNLFVIRI